MRVVLYQAEKLMLLSFTSRVRSVLPMMLLQALLGCMVLLPLHAAVLPIEQEAYSIVLQKYENLQQTPLALIVVATGNCAGCSALAINHAITTLHEHEPALPCVVVVIADEALEVATIRDRFFTPYVIADTTTAHKAYVAASGTALPLFAVIDSSGTVVFRREDIQHNQPDYATSIAGITIPTATRERAKNIDVNTMREHREKATIRTRILSDKDNVPLEEPDTRSVGNLASPVVVGTSMMAVNSLTGALESWDITTGTIGTPIKVPDTVAYMFRPHENDAVWKKIREQGYEMSRFVALSAMDDTLYALVKLLRGYRIERVIKQSAHGTSDTVFTVLWQPGQVVVRFEHNIIKSITAVPAEYSLISLVAGNSNYVGGSCSHALGARASAGDSVVFFLQQQILDTPDTTLLWKMANTGAIISSGAVAAAPDGKIWYCDPMQSQFYLLQPDGSRKDITAREILSDCGSPIRLVSRPSDTGFVSLENQFRFSYILNNMIAVKDTVFLFFRPAHPSSTSPYLLQTYTTTGEFLGEETLYTPVLAETRWAHLLSVDNTSALVLLNSNDNHWNLMRVPAHKLPFQSPSQARSR